MSKTKPKALNAMIAKAKAKQEKGPYQTTYPRLWEFFDGAFSSNSGGHPRENDFLDFTLGQLSDAEEELKTLQDAGLNIWLLGSLADDGYTVFGQTHQNKEGGDDEQHKLIAFELLESRY